jgi:hypothetical protein
MVDAGLEDAAASLGEDDTDEDAGDDAPLTAFLDLNENFALGTSFVRCWLSWSDSDLVA